MAVTKHPTTGQLHEHSHAMNQQMGRWSWGPGVASGLRPGAVHELKLVQSGADSFLYVPPGGGGRWWRSRPGERRYTHRVAARLWMLGNDEPELLLMDVLASTWNEWAR